MTKVKVEPRRKYARSQVPITEPESASEFTPMFAQPVAGRVSARGDAQQTDLGRVMGPKIGDGQIQASLDRGRLNRLRGVPSDTGPSPAAQGQGAPVVRRMPMPKTIANRGGLDTDRPEEFLAAVMVMKKSGPDGDKKIQAIIGWLKANASGSPLIDQCQEIWIMSPGDLAPKKAPGPVNKTMSPEQKKHNKAQQRRRQAVAEQDLALDAAEQEQAAQEIQTARDQKLTDDVRAGMYWEGIQYEPGNSGHGASLKFLVEKKYVKVEQPHRCFLSRYEKNRLGNRDENKFGLSVKLTPIPKVGGRRDRPLVVHLHCHRTGRVDGAGIKFLNQERQAGDNILIEQGNDWLAYLRVKEINGDNVQQKVAAFD